jgi:hypothetical protein
MPGRRGRSWKRAPEPNLGPPGTGMMSRLAIAVAEFVTEDNLMGPSGLPDSFVIRHEDIASLGGGFGATEMVGERRGGTV